MSQLKLITASRFERLLLVLGFAKVRQKGSHRFYRHPDGRTTTIPHHSAKDLPRPLLRTILREIRLSLDEYNALVKD
ncbi:MAG: type II toxin-antitoxin system HicA family toxin [Planctomycetaceae bacterium]|nr:type II toxin-antitoxin system HicA family toxin [Planctomycetaceae bacterium]